VTETAERQVEAGANVVVQLGQVQRAYARAGDAELAALVPTAARAVLIGDPEHDRGDVAPKRLSC